MPDEKALFVNETMPDGKLYEQFYRRLMFKRNREALILALILFILLLVLVLPRALAGRPPLDTGNLLPFLIILFSGMLLLFAFSGLPAILSRKIMKKQREVSGGLPVLLETEFFTDHAVFRSSISNKTTDFPYSDFLRMTETEDLFLVQTKNKQTLLFSKSGFSQGDPDSFRDFLSEKI